MSNTRIVYVTTVDLTIRLLLLDQLRHLRQAGYQVSAVCARGPWTDEIRATGIPVHSVDLRRQVSPLADLVALVALVQRFRAVRPGLVHTHTPKANLLGRLAARLAGVPVVVGTEHGFYFYGMTGLRRRFCVWLSRLGARRSDAVFLVNAEDMDTARRESICRPGQAVLLTGGVGVDLNRFVPDPEASHARAAVGLPPDAPVVGMVGRLTYEKGYGDFFRAAVTVRQALPEARFLVAGPADRQEEAEFRRLVASLGLADAVTGVPVDPEQDQTVGLRLHECGHLARVHRIDAAVPVGGREQDRRVARAGPNVVVRRVGPQPFEVLGVLRGAVLGDPETRDEQVLVPQHVE